MIMFPLLILPTVVDVNYQTSSITSNLASALTSAS